MKKNFWLLGVAVAALTSCTQSEVLDIPESRVIGFDSFVSKNTRAVTQIQQPGSAENDLKNFYVSGYATMEDEEPVLHFNGVTCSYTGTGYDYTNKKIWALNTVYDFAAYSNGNSTFTGVDYELATGATSGSSLTFMDYEVGEKDLLAAIVPSFEIDGTGSNIPQTVSLPFEHMLSCVRITLTNGATDPNVYLKFSDITFEAVKTDDCVYAVDENNVKTITWGNTTSTSIYESIAKENYTFKAPTEDGGYVPAGGIFQDVCFFIPQTNGDKSFSFTVTSYEKKKIDPESDEYSYVPRSIDTYNASLALTVQGHTSWQPGYQYNYAAEVNGKSHYIRFSASVATWTHDEHSLSPTQAVND